MFVVLQIFSKAPVPQQHSTNRNVELVKEKETWRLQFRDGDTQEVYSALLQNVHQREQEAHVLMHILGELLYEEKGMESLTTCTEAYGFGCYHGFFTAAIAANGIEILPKLDASCKQMYGLVDTRCQHGLGHGILVYTGYENLPEALRFCSTLTETPLEACAGGVFMEYNFHTMEAPSGAYLRPLESDVYAPCSSLPSEFLRTCFLEQPQWWEQHFQYDFQKMGELCAALPSSNDQSDACFQGIGKAMVQQVQYNYDEIIHICSMMPSDTSAALCREGSSWLLIGRGGEDRDAYLLLCDSLSVEKREACRNTADAW